MAFLGQTFNASELPESENNFDPIPAGWYNVSISDAELKATKAGTGEYIAVRYTVTGPTHEGRIVFGNLNIKNPNPKAEEIGRQQLGELMRAIGLSKVEDTDELIGGDLQIKVSVRPAKDGYDASNDVKAYKTLSSMQQSEIPSPEPEKGKTTVGAPPWAKK